MTPNGILLYLYRSVPCPVKREASSRSKWEQTHKPTADIAWRESKLEIVIKSLPQSSGDLEEKEVEIWLCPARDNGGHEENKAL